MLLDLAEFSKIKFSLFAKTRDTSKININWLIDIKELEYTDRDNKSVIIDNVSAFSSAD